MFLSVIPVFYVVLLAFLLRAAFNYYRGPLSHLPGPWYTHFTGLSLLYTRAVGTSRQHLRHLHTVHGPVVRVGPREVSINSVDGYYKVHGVGSHCLKAPVFDRIRFSHSSMLFTMRDPRIHSERKRIVGRGFASIREEQETKIRRLASKAVANIKNEAEKGQADVYKWWRCLAVDVVSEMSFGKSFNLLHSGGKGLTLYKALSNAGPCVVFQAVLPRRLISLFKWSPITWLRDVSEVAEIIFNRVTAALGELRVSSNCGPSIARHLLSHEVKGNKHSLNDDELSSEVGMLLVAGSDSTATTLTYATWEIVRDPDLRRQIEEEIGSLPVNFTAKDVEALPILNSVLEEVLRMYNPAGALVERLVPPSGICVDDWDLPGGTMVYTTGWLISRLEDVFPDPDRFLNLTPDMKRAHVPFNIGARRCVGMHVARMEILVTLAILFRECRGLQLHHAMKDEMMAQVGEFFIVPKAGRRFSVACTYPELADRRRLAARRESVRAEHSRPDAGPVTPESTELNVCAVRSPSVTPRTHSVGFVDIGPRRTEHAVSGSAGAKFDDLPPRAIGLALLDIYFERLYNATLLFNRTQLFESYLDGSIPPYLLRSIFALSSLFLRKPRHQPPRLGTHAVSPELAAFATYAGYGDAWAEAARREAWLLTDRPTVQVVQALSCLNLYWFATRNLGRARINADAFVSEGNVMRQYCMNVEWEPEALNDEQNPPSSIMAEHMRLMGVWARRHHDDGITRSHVSQALATLIQDSIDILRILQTFWEHLEPMTRSLQQAADQMLGTFDRIGQNVAGVESRTIEVPMTGVNSPAREEDVITTTYIESPEYSNAQNSSSSYTNTHFAVTDRAVEHGTQSMDETPDWYHNDLFEWCQTEGLLDIGDDFLGLGASVDWNMDLDLLTGFSSQMA
ncbi:hypothetical protein FANTH_2186 [Fusarium anthophilum]|uniref:Cytochrome P450 n=1 Tax=Fusarium anthophilum TaxID=48485 RepID=A0A8H5EAK8_9HYPO|nr:hypothetical protein FANTH_2186 [Fusarium anthophilum]